LLVVGGGRVTGPLKVLNVTFNGPGGGGHLLPHIRVHLLDVLQDKLTPFDLGGDDSRRSSRRRRRISRRRRKVRSN